MKGEVICLIKAGMVAVAILHVKVEDIKQRMGRRLNVFIVDLICLNFNDMIKKELEEKIKVFVKLAEQLEKTPGLNIKFETLYDWVSLYRPMYKIRHFMTMNAVCSDELIDSLEFTFAGINTCLVFLERDPSKRADAYEKAFNKIDFNYREKDAQ